jgi:hypothetical protein
MSLFPIVDGRARFDASSNASSDSYSAGIRFTQEGAARSTTNTGTSFNQGIPMSESGQVSLVDASSGLPANVVWLSGLPISGDKVCISNKPVSVVSSGIPYDSAGAVAATVAPITTNATLDLVFAGVSNDLLSPTSYTLTTDFITPQYQVGAQYSVWDNGLVQKNFADIVTFTRASTGTYFNSAGTLTTAAINEARFDYNPSTLAAQGLLIEEQRTNSIRNNTMQGAAAGTPGTLPTNWIVTGAGLGTLTQTVVGTGTANGITYVDIQLSGTTSTTGVVYACEPSTGGISASSGQTWTGSTYTALVAGSITNITAINAVRLTGRTSGGAASADSGTSGDNKASLTSTLQRFTSTITLADATTANLQPGVSVSFSSGVAIDITLRIGLPQLEQGAFATSVIPTTTTALTRSQDRAVVNTLSPWYNSVAGTFYAEFAVTQPSSGANQFVARVSDNSYNNQIGDLVSSTGFPGISTASGGVFDGLASTAIAVSANTVAKFAGAYATNDLAASLNGGTVGTDNTATIPSGMTRFDLGSDHAGFNNVKAGYLRRITYYPRRLANADLQTITT